MIYLDNAATKSLSNTTKEYLISILDTYGNPSSLHSIGEKSRQTITNTRKKVAKFINANSQNIYFTCGGSASNTLGIKGYCEKNMCSIFYSSTSHKSILNLLESNVLKNKKTPIKVDSYGIIDLTDLEYKIAGTKPFVIVEYANSEIGTIQNIKKIIEIVHFYKGIIYVDCTGSVSSIPLDVETLDIDICGFSAHKLGALKGSGILYKKKNIDLEPLIYGNQEQGIIGGTENILGIASLGNVVENYNYSSISSANRDYVYNYIMSNISNSYLVGASIESGNRLLHNLYMCFRGIEGESLMMLLDMNGIQVSTGSACNSGNLHTSTTLSAIGMDEKDIHSCIRLSFSGQENKEALDYVCDKLKQCVESLRKLNTQ